MDETIDHSTVGWAFKRLRMNYLCTSNPTYFIPFPPRGMTNRPQHWLVEAAKKGKFIHAV